MDQPQPNISINNAQPQSGDHDLLLTLKAEVTTKLDRVISDVKDLKDDTVARIGALEQQKVNKAVFETYRIQATKDFEEYKRTTDGTHSTSRTSTEVAASTSAP